MTKCLLPHSNGTGKIDRHKGMLASMSKYAISSPTSHHPIETLLLLLSMKQALPVALSLAAVFAICRAVPATLGLSFDKRAGSLPTLVLPYATYQATNYNPDGDVSLPIQTPKSPLIHSTDIHIQKHPLRRSTSRRSSMGQTSASRERDRNPRRFIRPHLYPSANSTIDCHEC